MTLSMLAAAVVVDEWCALGIRDVVLSPGSRSAPLAYALHAADAERRLRLHVRVDERTAGFLALGLAKASEIAVPVVTTSGTAAGNLLPALMEAHHAGVPVVAVTADRPAGLVGTGANQTADQVGMFAGVPRASARIVASEGTTGAWRSALRRVVTAASGVLSGLPGPAHFNVELPDPLYGDLPEVPPRTTFSVTRRPDPIPVELPAGPRTVVVAGDLRPAQGRAIADEAASALVPLFAEPSSNARQGASAIAHYRSLLRLLGPQVERVVVVGHPTLSRPISTLLARHDAELIVVADGATWVDPGWAASQVVGAVSLPVGDSAWLSQWRRADAAVFLPEPPDRISGELVAREVIASAVGEVLVLGASNPIRDADLAPTAVPWPTVYANRGLAGIDGTVSTAVGIALATNEPTTALMGDLTFLHDASGLVIPPGEPVPTLRIVIADDNGGSIFATLEHGAPERADSFERVFATPPGVDIADVAKGYGVPVTEVNDDDSLTAALARDWAGIEVIVVRFSRKNRRARAQDLAERSERAVRGL